MGEIINKYLLEKPFQSKNAGFSRWTTARKGVDRFFLKELMNPKYPDDESLRETLRAARIKECELFEKERTRLFSAINNASDGNLVRIEEFFRADSRFYVSTAWIDYVDMPLKDVARLDLKDKLFLCRTAAHSLACLHEKKIVHADIKDTNVLIHKTKGGRLVTKIVDFGSSFFEESPPANEDDLGGDQVYLSPEACLFICGEEVELTCKMDVFALGLLIHQYLTGELPYFDGKTYNYAHEAVLDDVVLKADSANIPFPVREIINHMLILDADRRISAKEAYFLLTSFYEQTWPVSRPLSAGTRKEKEATALAFDTKEGTDGSGYVSPKLRMSKNFLGKTEETYTNTNIVTQDNQFLTQDKRDNEKTGEVHRSDRDWNRETIENNRNKKILLIVATVCFLVMGVGILRKSSYEGSYSTDRIINNPGTDSGEENDTHTHKWENATCTRPKTCSICGATEGSALGHDWIHASCTEPKTCRRCRQTQGKALEHKWKDATYEEPKTCERCGTTIGNVKGYVSSDSLCEGYFSEESVSLGDYKNYPWVFQNKLKKCKKIKIGYEITPKEGNPLGTFECWILSKGEWKLIGTVEVEQANKEYIKTYTMDPALDVEAIMMEPQNYIEGDVEWTDAFLFYEAQVE